MTRQPATALPIIIALLAGALLWEMARAYTTRRDVFDGAFFWTVAYPASIALSLLFGFIWRDRPWRWPASIMVGQAVWSLARDAIRNGVANLFPLTLIMFAVLSLPCIGAAYVGKWIGERLSR